MTSIQELIQLFHQSLRPQTTHKTTYYLESIKNTKGFATNLLLISDQESLQLPIRTSVMVYLKNLIEEQSKNQNILLIDPSDFTLLKDSILSLLTKFIYKNEIKLLPTLKYICFLLVKYYFKQGNWENLLPELIKKLEQCQSQESIKGTLIIIKIIFQILGKSLTEQIKLNNVANKIMLPLTNVASKMFANFSEFSCSQLQQIFKILTQAIEFHLPQIVQKNIHIFMVLVKNVLDLKTEEVNQNQIKKQGTVRILRLKKEALTFLEKMYQRHSTSNLCEQNKFVDQFNKKYTRPYFETIVAIMMQKFIVHQASNHSEIQSLIISLNFSIATHALGIFSFIAANKQSSKYIEQDLIKYQVKILYLSMQKFLNCHSHKLERKIVGSNKSDKKNQSDKMKNVFQNYTDLVDTFREERLGLRLFLSTIFSNKNVHNQEKNVEEILQLLLKCVVEGSFKQKELALYLLSSLEREIELLTQFTGGDINLKMLILLKEYVFPLLSIETKQLSVQDYFFASLVKLRGYEMYARYEYLEIGVEHSSQVCEKIFQEICSKNKFTQMDLFVKIQAIETFNCILGNNDQLIPKLSSNISSILRVYTQLLSQDFEMMKFYDEILSLFSAYIGPIVYELLQLLADMFFKLNEQKLTKFNCLNVEQIFKGAKHSQLLEQDELTFNDDEILEQSQDNQTIYEDILHNYDNIGTQCLASIKKLTFKHPLISDSYQNSLQLKQKLLMVILHGLSSRDETFIKEALSILNILLYKHFISDNFHYLLPAMLYPVFISQNHSFAQQIQSNIVVLSTQNQVICYGNNIQNQIACLYTGLLKFISRDATSRPFALSDQIGCIKNFIKVIGKKLYTIICPISNKNYLQMLIQAVIYVQQGGQCQNYSKNQILSMLSVYQVLLQNKIFQEGLFPVKSFNQNETILHPDQYFEVMIQNIVKWSVLIQKSALETQTQQKFKSFYFRIIMLGIYTYPNEFFRFFQMQFIAQWIPITSPEYPIQKVFNQLDNFIIQKVNQSLKPLNQLQQQSFHTLNNSYIYIKGVFSLVQLLVRKFILGDQRERNQHAIHQRIQSLNSGQKRLFSKLLLIIIKLSVQVAFLAANEFSNQKQEQTLSASDLNNIQFAIDEMISKQISFTHKDTNLLGSQNDSLIKLLSNLTVQTSQPQSQSQEMNSNQKSNILEAEYQNHFKLSKSIMSEPIFGFDESQNQSNGSSQCDNPFDSYDEQYLYAYDSPIFGGFLMENKKKMLMKIIQDLMQIQMDKNMFYLKKLCRSKHTG